MFNLKKNEAEYVGKDTDIRLTMGQFITIIITLLGIFFTFYMAFINPQFAKIDRQFERYSDYQLNQLEKINNDIDNINASLQSINNTIENINKSRTTQGNFTTQNSGSLQTIDESSEINRESNLNRSFADFNKNPFQINYCPNPQEFLFLSQD
jgi:methyl-accepting chemotaxis protein